MHYNYRILRKPALQKALKERSEKRTMVILRYSSSFRRSPFANAWSSRTGRHPSVERGSASASCLYSPECLHCYAHQASGGGKSWVGSDDLRIGMLQGLLFRRAGRRRECIIKQFAQLLLSFCKNTSFNKLSSKQCS